MNEDIQGALRLRPYQMLCAVCALEDPNGVPQAARAPEILAAVRQDPDRPITLVCSLREVFSFQTCRSEAEAPEGDNGHQRLDLEILYRLQLPPGACLSARILFHRLLDCIPTTAGFCEEESGAVPVGQGCSRARRGCYEQARAQGIEAILPPRSAEAMARAKRASLTALYAAKATGIAVKPHLLLCAVCQYGGGVRPPYPPDNPPELLELILAEPDTRLTLTEGAPWMVCGSCPARAPARNVCVNVKGAGGLTNQLRDLRTLQRLGLPFGTTLAGRALYRLVLERIPDTRAICAFDSPEPSVWWDGCGAANCRQGNIHYEQGRQALLARLGSIGDQDPSAG